MQKFYAYGLGNFMGLHEVKSKLSKEQIDAIKIVGSVLPFKTNNFVVEQLIDWDNIPNDPIYQLTFPQEQMLLPEHFNKVRKLIKDKVSDREFEYEISYIRSQLNPNPASQMEQNLPSMDSKELKGLQHKYPDTILFFPSQGQTCHAYCTFCFRWPQFIGDGNLKFQMKEIELLVQYLKKHPEITDVLLTGGDPMIMNSAVLGRLISPLLNESELPNIQTIRIGTKSLTYWPYKYTSDPDADNILRLFETIIASGKNLAIMAHINHPVELRPIAVQQAIHRVLSTGAQIRTQAPIMNHINNSAGIWSELWNEQAKLGCVPYYMFIARDTGAQNYFAVPLVECLDIYSQCSQNLNVLARTARGPCMSATPGKFQILGITSVSGESLMILKLIRARNKQWVNKIFYAKFDDKAIWLNDLEPAFSDQNFFYEE